MADEPPNMQFLSSQSMKLPPSNSALPSQALGSVAGLGVHSLNSVRQVSRRVAGAASGLWERSRVCRPGGRAWGRGAAPKSPRLLCRTATPACSVSETPQHKPGACRRQHSPSARLSPASARKCLLHCSPLR